MSPTKSERLFPISRNGELIHHATPKRTIDTGLHFLGVPGMVTPYEEWDAAVGAGLDLWKWEQGEYSRDFMVRVVAFNQQRRAVELNSNDAVQAKMEADAKKQKRKGR